MKIFLCYASEDQLVAERIYFALVAEGHQVFFDRTGVDAGEEFNRQIRNAITGCDRFVFLVSPHSVERGGYTLTELRMAQARWNHPASYVLPVMIADTDLALVPNYLKAVTVLEPHGDVAAEVAAELGRSRKRRPVFTRRALFAVASLVVAGLIVAASTRDLWMRPPIVRMDVTTIEAFERSSFGYLYIPCPPKLLKCPQSFSERGLSQPDTLDRNNLSKLILREDNRVLGPAHSGHKDIGDVGQGRFSHWFEGREFGEYLYFSTSDNTDPRKNGRKYTVTVPDASAPPVLLDNSMFKKYEPPLLAYRYKGTGLSLSTPDSLNQPNVSRLLVLEDGKALGPAHSNPIEVREIGRGRYSHVDDGQEWLFFSASDNTDPRTNGRTYEISVEPKP